MSKSNMSTMRHVHNLAVLIFVVAVLMVSLVGGRAAAPQDTRPVLYLVGDSTMADKPVIPPNPERGWGQLLPLYFRETIRIENHAMNGRSSLSFLTEKRWAAITNRLKAGDWVIIQFGHNDQKADTNRHTEPFGSFKQNLARYVRESQALGAQPILATPVVRRKFDASGALVDTHGDYVAAGRQAAAEERVPLLELNTGTAGLVRALGPEASKKLYLWVGPEEFPALKTPKQDDTHFCAYGASRVCDLAVEEIRKRMPTLAGHLRSP